MSTNINIKRIRAHYLSLKKRLDPKRESMSTVWMTLARQWKMPIQEIKHLIGYRGSYGRNQNSNT